MAETLQDVNHIHPLSDFVQGGIDYLPGDFLKQKENLVKFLSVYLRRLQQIDEMLVNLSEGRLLANATYMNLDEIGRQLGIDRNGMSDDSYRAQITILLASASKHGTRPEVIQTLRQLFGDGNFTTWKGENYRVDIHVLSTCFRLEDLLSELVDILPLPTHLRLIESYGRAFGFNGDTDTFGFSSVASEKTGSLQGGLARVVYTSDMNNTGYVMTIAVDDILVNASEKSPIGITISISDAVIEEAQVSVSPTSVNFGDVIINEVSPTRTVTITNGTSSAIYIDALTLPSSFSLAQGSAVVGEAIEPNTAKNILLQFTPIETGTVVGELSITTSGFVGTFPVSLVGVGQETPVVSLQRLVTEGNQFVTSDEGKAFRLKSVNWFGMEGENFTPHGTWVRNWKEIINQIKGFGFNSLRIPLSGSVVQTNPEPLSGAINYEINPEFIGKTSLEILDLIIEYCGTNGMYVVIDHHRRSAGTGADGSPIDSSYTLATWIDTWKKLALRYKDHTNVVGADIHNEPHDLEWNTWAGYAEQVGNAIHEITPEWIIFVEGVGQYNGTSYWWGGQLQGALVRPVVLNIPHRVAYSPHEYGQSVGVQDWLAYDGQTPPSGWPNNLFTKWSLMWGHLFLQNLAPIWIGEFGGHFGVDGNGNLTKPNAAYETQWATRLMGFINGDENVDDVPWFGTEKKGISFAYWSYNPNSGDTGGLVQDDWITPQTVKLNIIASALEK